MGVEDSPVISRLSFSIAIERVGTGFASQKSSFRNKHEKTKYLLCKVSNRKIFFREKQAKYPQKIDFKMRNML